jgi:phosphatidate cytidylyltransferase
VKQRSKSAVGVVIAGLVPALLGGPIFAAAWLLFCYVGYREFRRLAGGVGADPGHLFALALPLAALIALTDADPWAIVATIFGVSMLGLVAIMRRVDLTAAFEGFAFGAAAVVYLAIPTYAAIRLREIEGAIEPNWLDRFQTWLSMPWDANPRGLAWFLVVLCTTWLCDTGQYLAGRTLGKHPLSPRISPKKTVEGFLGGLVLAAGAGALAVSVFGLDVNPLYGAGLGAALAVVAIAGDLSESLFKRQAGVKDSGDFIPGHGGMLDRIDSLLFTFTVGWIVALLIDGTLW